MSRKHIIVLEFDEEEFKARTEGLFWDKIRYGKTPIEFVESVLDEQNFNSRYYIKDHKVEEDE